jgi:glyoxalase/bleomycin resistance protein/dioxygenase superfamily protein
MDGNHFHVVVRGLDDALGWFARVVGAKPTFKGDRMAVLPFGPILLVLDEGEEETITTIGYSSADCDADFATLTGRGAAVIEPPEDRAWGVRVAYLQGPGRLVLEIEQPLTTAETKPEKATWDARAWLANAMGCERDDLTVRSIDHYGEQETQVRYELKGEAVARVIVRGPIVPMGVQPGHGHRAISAVVGSGMEDLHSIDIPESQEVIF